MSEGKQKRVKTLTESFDHFDDDFHLGSSVSGFQFGFEDDVAPPGASLPSVGHAPPALGTDNVGFGFGAGLGTAGAPLMTAFNTDWTSTVPGAPEETTGALEELKDRLKPIGEAIGTLEWDLRNYIPPLNAGQYKELGAQIDTLASSVQTLQRETRELINHTLLLPTQLEAWKDLDAQLEERRLHLDVYRKELTAVFESKWPEVGLGMLVVTSQPFPAVVKQKEKKRAKQATGGPVDEPLQLKLLTGARAALVIKGPVKAEMVWEVPQTASTKKSAKADKAAKTDASTIINNTAPMTPQGTTMFEQLRFSKGTGVKSVRLKFYCKAETTEDAVPGVGKKTFQVASNATAPLIVMTNESQFSDSAGKLLETEAFSPGTPKIPWTRVANLLQVHYLMCTRQPLSKIARPLTRADLHYIWKTQFHNTDTVDHKSFDSFWSWFGVVLHKIRHQKPVPQMWEKGLLFGFISKEAAQLILKGHKAGTFLVRFSERSAGQFAVAYVDKKFEVKHYLIPNTTKKLSDVIKAKSIFTDVLLCKADFAVQSFEAMVKGTMNKDGAFGDFYSNSDEKPPLEGYDDLAGEADEDE